MKDCLLTFIQEQVVCHTLMLSFVCTQFYPFNSVTWDIAMVASDFINGAAMLKRTALRSERVLATGTDECGPYVPHSFAAGIIA